MNGTTTSSTPPAPPGIAIAEAAAVALSVALIVLVAFILPAEYGIDPLGTGDSFGLMGIAAAESGGAVTPIVPSSSGPLILQQDDYREDSMEFTLRPNQFVEYKYLLPTGATMLYTWSATAPVELDFHTEPAGLPPEASDSFERSEASEGGRGSYRAPYDGIHGWYWHNRTDQDITVRLTTAGFYTRATEFRDDGSTVAHQVSNLTPPVD